MILGVNRVDECQHKSKIFGAVGIIPIPADPAGIGGNEFFPVRNDVGLGIFLKSCAAAAGAMEKKDNRGCVDSARHMDDALARHPGYLKA